MANIDPADTAGLAGDAASNMSGVFEDSDMLVAARDYLHRGWHPLRLHHVQTGGCSCGNACCPTPGKHPDGAWKSFQRCAPIDLTLRTWFPPGSPWNVGLVHGQVPGSIVLDFDRKTGGLSSQAQLEQELGVLPITPTVTTGGGGKHYYFRHPGVYVPTRKRLRPGFDVRGDGGLTVAPPSLHESGTCYEWSPDAHPDAVVLEDLPQSWIDFICAPTVSEHSVGQNTATSGIIWENSGEEDPKVVDGRETYLRDTVLAVLTELYEQGQRIPQVGELFDAVWRQYSSRVDFSRPGRGSDEVLDKCRRAVAKAQTGAFTHIKPDATPLDQDRRGDAEDQDLYQMLSLAEALNLPPPQWLFDGLLLNSTVAALYGPPGALKSFLALHLAMSLAHGETWAGRPLQPAAVCYVAAEGAAGTGMRLEGWLLQHYRQDATASCDVPFRLLPLPINLADKKVVEKLLRSIRSEQAKLGRPFKLLVIDTLGRCSVGIDENSAREVGVLLDAAIYLRLETGATVLFVHHTGKDTARGMRGSSRLLGDVDCSIEVKRDDDGLTATVVKQKDAPDGQEFEFDAQSVALPRKLGRHVESTLVLVRSDNAKTASGGAELQRKIAQVLAPDRSMTISKLMSALGMTRGSTTQDRIRDVVPDGGVRVVTDTGMSLLRRVQDKRGERISCEAAHPAPLTFLINPTNSRDLPLA